MTIEDPSDILRAGDSRSDEELVAQANRGDAGAFEVLYLRYRDWVVNVAHRFTGSEDLALDVLQETFLYFLRKFPGFELRATLKTFLYPAVKNLSIAARRKAQLFTTPEESRSFVESLASPDPASSGSSELAVVLAELSEEHREVLWLRFVDGLTLAEISGAIEIPLGTVKSRVHNALTILRKDPRTREFYGR